MQSFLSKSSKLREQVKELLAARKKAESLENIRIKATIYNNIGKYPFPCFPSLIMIVFCKQFDYRD